MTGSRTAHPLLIGLANLHMDVRMKYSNKCFLLCTLLPVPKFIHPNKRMRGVLSDRLVHHCLDIVLEPLKIGAKIGIMMSDPLGTRRFCFTPLAAYIADYPEAIMLAGVGGKTSPLTMAMYKRFGDSFRHEPRTASTTLAQLEAIKACADPDDLETYFKESQKFRLNGVDKPFWRNWAMADPPIFLTPEPLHAWHKQFWDHDVKWCIRAVGEAEIDFRFSVLPHVVRFRSFPEGISKLKQVTGRAQRDVQRYIIGVIAGAVPQDFVIAIRSLMDFRYLSQSTILDDDGCSLISASLAEFHHHKAAILAAGARVGKGNQPIDNWYIPKLELMQSVEPSIRCVGTAIQWSADLTEHAHITEVKTPARSTNNQSHDAQICRFLDRRDKCDRFAVAVSTCERLGANEFTCGVKMGCEEDEEQSDHDDMEQLDGAYQPDLGQSRTATNYFAIAERLKSGTIQGVCRPYRTFSVMTTAFHLSRDPSANMTIDEVMAKYCLPDLRPALADFICRVQREGMGTRAIGGRRIATESSNLPFDRLQIWEKLRIQGVSYHNPGQVVNSRTLRASPPSAKFPIGCYDTAIVNVNENFHWPSSGINGAFNHYRFSNWTLIASC